MHRSLKRGLATLAAAAGTTLAIPTSAAPAQPPRCGEPSGYDTCFVGRTLHREGYIWTCAFGVR